MTKKTFFAAAAFFVLFALLIAAVKLMDVQAIGPDGSEIGLATVNAAVRDFFGVNTLWYDITEITGYIAIAVAGGFALLGGFQLIKRKSIKKADADIIALGIFYAVVACVYLIFEIFIVNYRPVPTDGVLEASFPSSHTVLAVCIYGTAIYRFVKRLKGVWRAASVTVSAVLLGVTVIGRLISGVHWFTDIIGGVLISCALICTYIGACGMITKDV